jgi:hypothetical protein
MIAELASIFLASGVVAATGPQLTLITYRPSDRSVSNWRWESIRHLDLDPANTALFLAGKEPARLPRCIRLNNYWCIKSARWDGEIATDKEGHVAFSTAQEGAAVSVALLRRYYLEFGRKSAMSIVSRWAPAQCGLVAINPAAREAVSRASADALTTRGIGNTLRARYLANKGHAVSKGRRAIARSVVPDRPVAMMRAPAIAAGMGERSAGANSTRLASLGSVSSIASGDRGGAAIPKISCSGEAVRIRNYANAVIQGIATSIDDDLKLFETDGAPAPNLARVMVNMSAVEIGPYRPGAALIERVVRSAIRVAEEKRVTKEAAPAP